MRLKKSRRIGSCWLYKNELLKNEEYFELAKQISEAFQEAKNEKINEQNEEIIKIQRETINLYEDKLASLKMANASETSIIKIEMQLDKFYEQETELMAKND